MLQFDAEASRRVEATYMTPDVVEQRQAVLGAMGLGPGERVIDIGTGPGLLAAEIAAAVAPDGLVCGIDISESMLALARARTTRPNSAPMEFRQASADRLPTPRRASTSPSPPRCWSTSRTCRARSPR